MIKTFLKLLSRCYRLALPYGRLKLFAVVGLIFFNGILQMVGVTSIFPFFALAAEPDRIRNSKFGVSLLQIIPPMDNNHLLVVAGVFSVAMLVISSVSSLLSEVVRVRYAYGFCHWLRRLVLDHFARQPYLFYVQNNSSKLNQKIWDIHTFIGNVFLPLTEVITRLVVILFLVGTFFLVQPRVAIGSTILFGGFYLLVFKWLRPRAHRIGDELKSHYVGFAKNSYQFFHGIKTILVYGRSNYFIERAMEHSFNIGKYQAKIPIYSNGPRYFLEPLAFGGLVGIVVFLAIKGRSFSDIIPNLSVMALVGYRLLPTLQLLYSQLVTIASNNYTLVQLDDEVHNMEKDSLRDGPVRINKRLLKLEDQIELKDIYFTYPLSTKCTLESFNIIINKNESVGIVGSSGAGKSTLVDIMLGLYTPDSGTIMIDNVPIDQTNVESWRKMIGYVPQEIYLLDDTIEANIAFGIDSKIINKEELKKAAEAAQILDFIQNELPAGFNTVVGERGVRLSGGQRQRIGLARALYNNPQVLILDEATSALDHMTEKMVMDTIHKLQGTLTIITIAHRLTTLERCDKIVELGKL